MRILCNRLPFQMRLSDVATSFAPLSEIASNYATNAFTTGSSISISDGVNAWSVASESADLSASFFAASLLPYLALLYFLAKPSVNTPKQVGRTYLNMQHLYQTNLDVRTLLPG